MDDQTTDEIRQVSSHTPDFQTELAKKIQALVPEAVTDGKVDTQKLKELLDKDSADDSERFGLFWPGKKRAIRAAQEPTTATLLPAKDEGKDWDTTENIFIKGDNLETLKILQKYYHNKIKMIYIDPPYNTGQDFVYPDNYKEGLTSYLEFTKQVDDGGKRISSNSDTDGRYHSNWLNMMYPRLKLARNLLTDDGVIIISIDSNEVDNLKKLANEIFGEGNSIAEFVWKRRQNADSRNQTNVSYDHEYLIAFARNINKFKATGVSIDKSKYQNPDNDPRGPWASMDLTINATKDQRPNQFYEITDPLSGKTYPANPNRIWSKSRDVVLKMIEEKRILFPSNGVGRPREKKFLKDLQS
jgi:adenine-specific DNA-methyltransferase